MTTLLSSIPNLQGFPNMVGSSSSQQSLSKINLSSIMGDTIRIPTILVDSPIHTSTLPFSPPHPISKSPISQLPEVNIPSTSMNLPHKEVFPTSYSFTSLTFTYVFAPMNIHPLRIEIPLTQTQTNPLVIVQHQTTSSLEVMADFGEDVGVLMGKYYWTKKEKVVVNRGTKRAREGSIK